MPRDSTTKVLANVREFRPSLRVIKCKAKRGEAVGRKDARKSGPPVASTATAVELNQRRRAKMKKQAYMMIALLVLVGSMAVAAQAQTSGSRTQLIASIPFEFSVAGKTLPAGDYTVKQINPSSDHAVLQLRDKNGNSAMVQMNNVIGTARESARLVFNCYGSQHYFSQAWTSADANGLEAARGRAERQANEIAGMKVKSESVALRVR
jgi:hypothetical protein